MCDAEGRRWLIEAKGQTSGVGLDFRTGLGQLVQGALDEGLGAGAGDARHAEVRLSA